MSFTVGADLDRRRHAYGLEVQTKVILFKWDTLCSQSHSRKLYILNQDNLIWIKFQHYKICQPLKIIPYTLANNLQPVFYGVIKLCMSGLSCTYSCTPINGRHPRKQHQSWLYAWFRKLKGPTVLFQFFIEILKTWFLDFFFPFPREQTSYSLGQYKSQGFY